MAESKKNNNLLYATLVVIGLLLLLIPFFIFDVGSAVNGTGHLTRFGLHVLAFGGALVLGSLFSTGITSAAKTSVATMKVAAIATAVVVGGAVTYNVVQHATAEKKIVLNQDPQVYADPFVAPVVPDSLSYENISNAADSINTVEVYSNTGNDNSGLKENNLTPAENPETNTKIQNTVSKNTSEASKTPKEKTKNTAATTTNTTNSNTVLAESCNSFQVLHGSKQLDHRLGLSVFDPNKTIRFNNECGCILKDATMSLSRGNKLMEQKTQNGNFINLHTFKDLQADDRLTVEINKANCKDSKGSAFLYAFPKPILTVVVISDHREFETASESKANKKNPKETIDNSTVKPSQKDKVEEESNKFGN